MVFKCIRPENISLYELKNYSGLTVLNVESDIVFSILVYCSYIFKKMVLKSSKKRS